MATPCRKPWAVYLDFFPLNLWPKSPWRSGQGSLEKILDNFSNETVKKWTAQRDLAQSELCVNGLSIQAGVIAFLAVKVFSVFEETLAELHIPLGGAHTVPGLPIPLPSIEDIFTIANFVSAHRYHIAMVCWLLGLWLVLCPGAGGESGRAVLSRYFSCQFQGCAAWWRGKISPPSPSQLNQYLLAGVPLERALDVVAQGGLHPLYGGISSADQNAY